MYRIWLQVQLKRCFWGGDGVVAELVNRAKVGPTHAVVTDVVIVGLASEQQKFTDFQIRRE